MAIETQEQKEQRDKEFEIIQNWINDSLGVKMFTGKRLVLDDLSLRHLELIPTQTFLFSPKKMIRYINIGEGL